MTSEATFLRAILPSLPSEFAKKVRKLCATSSSDSTPEHVLETLIRFISGADCAPDATAEVKSQWAEKQQATSTILDGMVKGRSSRETKRPREEEDDSTDSQPAKRQRSAAENQSSISQELPADPLFTLHSVSTTSPVRKKVDLTIYKAALVLTHPSTHAVEANIPISNLTRAFLLPTRGKSKAHWSVVILSSDTSEQRSKPVNGTTSSSNIQVIFGIDAVSTTPFATSIYDGGNPTRNTTSKGTPTRSVLLDFLHRLGLPLIEPTPDVFKSACVGITSGVSANEDGVPGIEAYRGAKEGTLWFTTQGILWGESKPCEFWSVEDLIGKSEGVRVVGGTGRLCTVVLTRKSISESEDVGEDEEDMGVETVFGMVDSKERQGIEEWVRTYRNLFGKKTLPSERKTIMQIEDDSDGEDEDFEVDSDVELDGSEASSESSEDSDDDGEASENDANGFEEELTEEHHPLLRAGAMPRMNRAMMDVVVGLVEEEMLGGPADEDLVSEGEDAEGDEELEEDELND
ncbi:hypothetical protein H0H93_013934 [Arthromyces matolae]|nr:hypothetical protein H0H93_013934 [Arthromyces matolae]